MNWETLASEGVIVKPQLIAVMGPNGVGKTTLAAAFPKAMIADLEDGSANIANVKRFPRKAFPDFASYKSFLTWVLTTPHKSESLITDSLEALEDMISSHVCKEAGVESIEMAYGGYGKGLVRMREHMGDVMRLFQMIRDQKNMHVIIIAHTQVKPFTDPTTNQTYDRVIMRANDKFAAVVKDLSDSILFVKPKVYTETSKQTKKTIATSLNERVIHTQWSAGFDAKSRYSLPSEIPFTLENAQEVVSILTGNERDLVEKEIEGLMPMIADLAKVEAARKRITDANGDVTVLRIVRDRLKDLVGEKA